MMPLTPEESRLALVVSVERVSLLARYLVYAVAVAFYFAGHIAGTPGSLALITLVVMAHNLFAHGVLLTGRHDLFLRWPNFLAYFAEISFVIYLTGREQSVGYALYILLVVGYAAYSGKFRRTLAVAGLCCLAFGLLAWHESRTGHLDLTVIHILVRFVFILACAWLAGTLTEHLRLSEEFGLARARALAASEATLRTILDSAADPIVVFDTNELIVEANDSACACLGNPRQDLIGQRIRRFLFDDGTLPNRLAAARDRGEYRGELLLVTGAGEERTVDFLVRSFIRDGHDYYVVLIHDITEQKTYQEATRVANLNLERLNRELRQLDDLKTGFLVTVATRMRSPLTALLGQLELLLSGELGELPYEPRKALQACRRCAQRIARFAEDALALPRTDAAKPAAPEPGASPPPPASSP